MAIPTRREFITLCLVSVFGPAPTAAAWPWSKDKGTLRPFIDPGGRFIVSYPTQSWHVLTGGGSALLAIAHDRGDAAVVIEHRTMPLPLEADEISDLFAELEADGIKVHDPSIRALRSAVVQRNGRPMVVIDFERTGSSGHERVRHYVFPAGQFLYRVVCSAHSTSFDRYERAFVTIAGTFRSTPSSN